VDLNDAARDELTDLVHIGDDRADEIIDGRPWDDVTDLDRIDGIGAARLDDIHQQGVACVDE